MPESEEGIANFVQRGEIRVGGLRMCLFDITGGFYSIRESLEKTIGAATAGILYQAGVAGGKRFATSASRIGMTRRRAEGLADCIDIFSQAGFGNFGIAEVDCDMPHAIIECISPPAFEAFAFRENKASSKAPVCDYTRGVFSGFCRVLLGREDIYCIETACRASGSNRCVFEIGPQKEMEKMALQASITA